MSLNPKILITNATEIIGIQLISELVNAGEKIRVLKYENENFSHLEAFQESIEIFEADLLDISLLENAILGIEKIFHCKELLSFHPQDQQKLFDINIIGTKNIVNIALSLDVKKIVFFSSTLAFGTYQFKKQISEQTKWQENKSNTYYSICKHQAELEIHRAQAEGLETIIISPSFIIGKTVNKKNIYDLKNIAVANYSYYPKGKNGFVMLKDVSKVSIMLMNANISNEKFILSKENLFYKEVLEKLNPEISKKNIFLSNKFSGANLIWRINWMRSMLFDAKPFLSKDIYNFEGKYFEFESNKILEFLDFQYSELYFN